MLKKSADLISTNSKALRCTFLGERKNMCSSKFVQLLLLTLESGIDVGQGITVEPRKFVKKNKRRALNKHRA